MNIHQAIKLIEDYIPDSHTELPEDIFYFISRLTPIVNVDLLIKDEKGRTLLSWRDDKFSSCGWHIPGGIVRYKEKREERIIKVAEDEIESSIDFDPEPVAVHEIILKQKTRGHFISFLYNCYLPRTFIIRNSGIKLWDPGFLKWHNGCPDNLLEVHEIYRKFI